MTALILAALVAAVPLAFAHGHAVATSTITAELREIAAAGAADRPPRCDPG